MRKQYQFRVSPAVAERIDTLANKRRLTSAELLKIAVDIGLANLDAERHIDLSRQITLLEIIAALCDLIAKKIAPESADAVPNIVLRNLEKYHGKV